MSKNKKQSSNKIFTVIIIILILIIGVLVGLLVSGNGNTIIDKLQGKQVNQTEDKKEVKVEDEKTKDEKNDSNNNEKKTKGYTQSELEKMALDYYEALNSYRPSSVASVINDDGTVSIQLYDNMGDHNSTCDWYTVNPETAVGTDVLENKIDLKVKPTKKTSNDKFDINDYIGIWYESKDLEGYSDICLDLDENGRILVEFGIYRLATFDELNASLSGNVIKFSDKNGTNGTITLENNKAVLELNCEQFDMNNQKIEFNYKKTRKSTEILSGFNIDGTWKASDEGDYEGKLILNSDNTYSISVKSNNNSINETGRYKIYGNKVYFTTDSGKGGVAEYVYGYLDYVSNSGVNIRFNPNI